jgi:shikimate dehydrogenase
VYLAMPAESADEFLEFARALGVAGASITIPHKVALFERADAVDDTARAIGAINTLKRDGQRWLGMNSDLPGFIQPLDARGIALRQRRVAILGAGGAARAVAIAATAAGADLCVYARDLDKARPVAALAGGHVAALPPDPDSWDVLVNCTPIGMHPNVDATPVDLRPDDRPSVPGARDAKVVYDLIYNPLETRLLREARALGYEVVGGLDMLVAQAIAQFRWWTGLVPDPAPMHAAALARLAEFNHS